MNKKTIISTTEDIIDNLKVLAIEKETVRRKLVLTANKLALTAEKLAITAEEKEVVRKKLATTAKEKEEVRRKLAVTAAKLALTAEKLALSAKEKESVRRRLVVTAAQLASTAEKLAATAKEKENVRKKLAVTAAKLAITAEKLAVTAAKLAITAEKLASTAKEKETVRRKLALTAAKLAITAEERENARRKLVVIAKEKENVRQKLVITAKEKELVRQKLVITAKKLKVAYKTMEQKVIDRTKSLEMVRAKEEAILMSIGDGLIATDENGVIILINKTAQQLLDKKSKEMIGKIFTEVVEMHDMKDTVLSADKHPISIALIEKRIVTTSAGSLYYERKNKTKLPLAIVATPVILDNKVIGAIKVFRDVTYEREIDKAKTEFVSLASHQLRTPLSAVNWYAEMLLAGDAGELNNKQKKYLDEVYKSNQRMVELVNALLDVSCLELGTFVIEPESTDILKLAHSVINEQQQEISRRKIVFSESINDTTPLIKADPKLLRMILQNILSNSIKYTQIGGKVSLSIAPEDTSNIIIKISDNGYGIPKNQQDKIFTKLFRADNVRDKDTDGTGLGLYIVKSVVENSGGKIWFKSSIDEKTKGTTFYVRLPINGDWK